MDIGVPEWTSECPSLLFWFMGKKFKTIVQPAFIFWPNNSILAWKKFCLALKKNFFFCFSFSFFHTWLFFSYMALFSIHGSFFFFFFFFF